MKKTVLGFTIIELVITMAILAIVAVIGVPSYTNLIHNNKQNANFNFFLNGLHTARSEAVKRSKRVIACPSTDGTSCNSSVDWDSGWIIFVDNDKDDTHDSNEMLIRVQKALDSGYSLVGSSNVNNYIRFRPNGISLENGTFTLCDPRGESKAKAIVINITGRPRSSETDADGGALTCS